MVYSIELSKLADRELRKLPRAIQEELGRIIDSLAFNPRPAGCLKMKGQNNIWRIRTGDFRILYTIKEDQLVIIVARIGNRREVYR
ncbi:MAG: type II toxin-antitoxin system RelE/ParE family toxin [Magnetococcus sp. YQC-5]